MGKRKNKTPITESHPELMEEWDWDKNTELDPNRLTYGSNKKVWWKCNKGHEWNKAISQSARYKGCPYCLRQLPSPSYNLKTEHPEVAKQFCEKLNNKSAENYLPGSNQKVHWRCEKGHKWQEYINNRTRMDIGCPYCSGRRAHADWNLAKIYPEMIKDWDWSRNSVHPEEATPNYNKRVHWICHKCSHEWQIQPARRTTDGKVHGCPACVNLALHSDGRNSLARVNPDLALEYSSRNNLSSSEIVARSSKVVWWECSTCGHEWKSNVDNRSRGKGCPACTNKAVSENNCLSSICPEIAKEWNYDKNKIDPNEVVFGSSKMVWWLCSVCNYEWKASVHNRTKKKNGTGCPACTNKAVSENNCLSNICLEIAKEWNHRKNKLEPNEVVPGSNKKVWWLCPKCGHEWRTSVVNRAKGNRGCPCCAKGPVSKISQQWLDQIGIPPENREHRIEIDGKTYIVDGYDPNGPKIYEFLGSYWHGHKSVEAKYGKVNKVNGKPFTQLFQETKQRLATLKNAGYQVKYIWEHDYLERLKGEK